MTTLKNGSQRIETRIGTACAEDLGGEVGGSRRNGE